MKKYLLAMCVIGMIIICSCGTKKTTELDTTEKAIRTLDNTSTPQEPIQPVKGEEGEEAK